MEEKGNRLSFCTRGLHGHWLLSCHEYTLWPKYCLALRVVNTTPEFRLISLTFSLDHLDAAGGAGGRHVFPRGGNAEKMQLLLQRTLEHPFEQCVAVHREYTVGSREGFGIGMEAA